MTVFMTGVGQVLRLVPIAGVLAMAAPGGGGVTGATEHAVAPVRGVVRTAASGRDSATVEVVDPSVIRSLSLTLNFDSANVAMNRAVVSLQVDDVQSVETQRFVARVIARSRKAGSAVRVQTSF